MAASHQCCLTIHITSRSTEADASLNARAPMLNPLPFFLFAQEMSFTASRRSSSPVTRLRSPESSPSPSPPRVTPLGRRRLWSPPPRKKAPETPSRSSARSSMPKAAVARRPRSVVATTAPHLRLPSPSRLSQHRSQHDSRPPAIRSSVDAAVPGNAQPRRSQTPSRLKSVFSPPPTPRVNRQRPPPIKDGNRGSRSVASTILSERRRRCKSTPPTDNDIERVNSRLRRLAL